MKNIGPTRLVLIRSGKYEFCDIELIRPLHLIGPNNVGKTSLISTLQFLYIDQQQKMHFSRDLDQTRKYYFPDPDSYILFECLTPTGYRVLGVHGLGPVKGYQFERYSYRGEFLIEDYVDSERQIRPNSEIRARLSDREYTILEPSHLRAALTGIGDNKGVRLELLPMRDRGGYERFRKVFSNLLRLSHLSQEDLKRFLFEIYETEFQEKGIIDLESSYSSQYEKVRIMANEVKDLMAVADDIRGALLLADERDSLRSELPQLFEKIVEVIAQIKKKNISVKETIEKEQSQLATLVVATEKKQSDTRKELREVNEEYGVLKNELKMLHEEKQEFSSYFLPLEEAGIAQLKQEIEEIGFRLRSSAVEPVSKVEGRIAKNTKELKKQEELLAAVADSAANYLKQYYPEEEVSRIFQLFNHDLLGMSTRGGEIEIIDAGELHDTLKRLLSRINSDGYVDEAVRISFNASLQPDLQKYSDPAVISAGIEDLRAEIAKDTSTLQSAQESEQLVKLKNNNTHKLQQLEAKHRKYSAFKERCLQETRWEKELRKYESKQGGLEQIQDDLLKKQALFQEKSRELSQNFSRLIQEEERLSKRVRSLVPPGAGWQVKEPHVVFPEKIEDLIAQYEDKVNQERQKKEGLAYKLDVIEGRTYSRIKGGTEDETLRLLAEELDALTQKEGAVEKLWSGLTANLQIAIKNMLKDLETLKSKVENLNRQLSKVSVSNLSRLKLMLAENPQLVPRLKAVAARHDSPLFAGLQNADEAIGFIGEFLRKTGRIELLQLFELHFEVNVAGGASQKYTKLETIESNGTTITIKVLINLMLLRGLMLESKEVTIPFYLDEASSLDRENVRSIVEQSVKMGFTPILASPEAMDVADNLYFLKESKGRLMLGDEALVRINRKPAVNASHA